MSQFNTSILRVPMNGVFLKYETSWLRAFVGHADNAGLSTPEAALLRIYMQLPAQQCLKK